MKLLITGGAGFIGSNFVRYWVKNHPDDEIVILDALTYAGHLNSLKDIIQDIQILNNELKEGDEVSLYNNDQVKFVKGDITNPDLVNGLMEGVDTVVHFAAESHVDRSVIDPLLFVRTNVLGTATLLDAALKAKVKRFHHISTDEVFGELSLDDPPFKEDTSYDPRTPYSASKAGSDHLVRAYFATYGLPITISNCANNFGPFHDPEKLIPRFITNLLEGQKVPLMGKGENIRSWIFVDDHNAAVDYILQHGKIGETYCIGGQEKTNKEVTMAILKILNMNEDMIEYVEHRLGHDFRYALDQSKLEGLGWKQQENFESAIEKTVKWFKENEWWWKPLKQNRPNVDRSSQKGYSK